MSLLNYDQLPDELRWTSQWCLAGPDEKGEFKAPYAATPRATYQIGPTAEHYFKLVDYGTILFYAQLFQGYGIGFVVSSKDSYTCIDLDVKNVHNYPNNPELWTSLEQLERFQKIIYHFNSYTERSRSGQGFHIWVRGKIGPGLKRDGVEIYSQDRFMVCTGDVYLDQPIQDRQEELESLASEIQRAQDKETHNDPDFRLVELEETEPDEVIFKRACEADNADKFVALCEATSDTAPRAYDGSYIALGYETQSHADLALMSIFAFYSKSNSQCRRLFRQTGLAKREKATKNDVYLNYTLTRIRKRQFNEDKAQENADLQTAALMATLSMRSKVVLETKTKSEPEQPEDIFKSSRVTPDEFISNVTEVEDEDSPLDVPALGGYKKLKVTEEELALMRKVPVFIDWPPGLVGDLARYIFTTSPRPVQEVSIVAALGLMAGICGKAFHIPKSGLNLYLTLIARSAVGKEALHNGVADLVTILLDSAPQATNFVDFTDYSSGPALSKAVAGNSSFVNVSSEWGRKLKRLAMEDGREGPMQTLRTVMTSLYQKSGPGSIVGGIGYSDKEKNIASISGVAYSMIGETTPGTFYEALTDTMMEDGFLSRFTVIEYTGDRPPGNKALSRELDPGTRNYATELVNHAYSLVSNSNSILVEPSPKAAKLLDKLDALCDIEINKTTDESWRQMWNRAHLKVYRIAALLAACDNHINPIIYPEHVEWATTLIMKDIGVMRKRIKAGDVGVSDSSRERKLLDVMFNYLAMPVIAESYNIPEGMREAGIIPRKYLQISTQRVTSFTAHRLGQNASLDLAIKSLIDSGYLSEVAKDKSLARFGFQGRCFNILTLPLTNEEQKLVQANRKN